MNLQNIYLKSPVWIQNCFCTAYGMREWRKRFGGEFTDFLDWLEETQNWPLERLMEYQNQQLRAIIQIAYQQVPFWKDRFDKLGISPNDIQSVEDLGQLPILTKAQVQQAGDSILNQSVINNTNVIKAETSGSTGTPLVLKHTHECVQFQRALWWRHRHWYGIQLRCREGSFGSKLIVPQSQNRPPFWRHNLYGRQTVFSQYHLKDEFLGYYIDYFNTHKFDCFAGYPSIIYIIADYLERTGMELKNKPKVVFTGSENTEDFQRALIEKHIAPVTSHYGGAEYASLASRCPHGYYHVDMECGVTEIVPFEGLQQEDGKITGNIVVTGFKNTAMPLIRYNMADVGTLLPDFKCPCGRQTPVIERIDGRSDSYVITSDKRKVGRVSRAFMGRGWISESQVLQEQIGKIIVKIVKRTEPSQSDIDDMVKTIKTMLGDDIVVDIEFVTDIPKTKAGKFRAVISTVDS